MSDAQPIDAADEPEPKVAKREQHRPRRAPIECAADIMFGLNFYQGRCHLFDLRDLVKPENTARPSDGKPANVTFAVDDEVVKAIRGTPEDAKVACYIVVVPIEASRRQKPPQKLIVTPQEAARGGIIP